MSVADASEMGVSYGRVATKSLFDARTEDDAMCEHASMRDYIGTSSTRRLPRGSCTS